MAEASDSFGTYHYAMDNPVMFNDPMGDTAPAKATTTQYLQQFLDLANQRKQNMSFHHDWGNVWIGNDDVRYIFSDRASDFDEGGGGGVTGEITWNDLPTDRQQMPQNQGTSKATGQFLQVKYPVGFKQYVALIIGESSADHPTIAESAALGSTIINRLLNVQETLNNAKWINKIGTASAFDGVNTLRYKLSIELSIEQIAAKYPTQFAGALKAYSNWGTDYGGNSNRSYYWTANGLEKGYAYNEYLKGNMVRNIIGGTTFYAFKNSKWRWQ